MLKRPDYPRLVRGQVQAWARAYGPDRARSMLERHALDWPLQARVALAKKTGPASNQDAVDNSRNEKPSDRGQPGEGLDSTLDLGDPAAERDDLYGEGASHGQ